MKKNSLIFVLVLNAFLLPSVSARELVLVSANPNVNDPFTLFELRKLFMGHPVKKQKKLYAAIRNVSDDMAYQVFLQKIIHLSAKNYERKLKSKSFLPELDVVLLEPALSGIFFLLLEDSSRVSFVWRDQIPSSGTFNVIQTLWEGDLR